VANAQAQTAAEGYAIYQNGTGGQPACAGCHGADPLHSTNPTILNAAGNPAFLLTAWMMAPMNQYNYPNVIDANGRTAIATYLLYPSAGTQPFSLFSSGSLNFGSLNVGQSAQQINTLTNIGALAITGLAIQANPSAAGVTQSNTCPATLAPNASCTVAITFAPMANGTANAGFVASASNDANASDTFFVYASAGTPMTGGSSSGGGGGSISSLALLALLLLASLHTRSFARKPGRTPQGRGSSRH